MFSAAVAVSAGTVPELPPLRALVNKVLQLLEVGVLELMQAERIFANVWILAWGTLLPGLALANPVVTLASAAALAIPVKASEVARLETWVGSVATPAIA